MPNHIYKLRGNIVVVFNENYTGYAFIDSEDTYSFKQLEIEPFPSCKVTVLNASRNRVTAGQFYFGVRSTNKVFYVNHLENDLSVKNLKKLLKPIVEKPLLDYEYPYFKRLLGSKKYGYYYKDDYYKNYMRPSVGEFEFLSYDNSKEIFKDMRFNQEDYFAYKVGLISKAELYSKQIKFYRQNAYMIRKYNFKDTFGVKWYFDNFGNIVNANGYPFRSMLEPYISPEYNYNTLEENDITPENYTHKKFYELLMQCRKNMDVKQLESMAEIKIQNYLIETNECNSIEEAKELSAKYRSEPKKF